MLSYLDTAKHAAFGWSAQFGTILTFYICSNFDFVQITCKSGTTSSFFRDLQLLRNMGVTVQ